MVGAKVNYNERSWAIEMISQINTIVSDNDLLIKRAGGESTVSVDSKLRMFPDVILYGDKELSSILQGWELKMPDVPITDEAFVKDAQRKARFLRLDSCVIWNFQYVQFYIYDSNSEKFELARQWTNDKIHTREDVKVHRKVWEKTLYDVVLAVNEYLLTHQLRRVSLGSVISDSAIELLINGYKVSVAEELRKEANLNSEFEAHISQWWKDASIEYRFDEKDMYVAYARNMILNWACRILFAHLIKLQQNGAMLVDKIDFHTSPIEADELFKKITAKCDFYNVFAGLSYSRLMSKNAWSALVEFSLFLRENGLKAINQSMLQGILESTVKRTRRNLNGQFTTPSVLARILVRMTVRNWLANTADFCCGTGTIPHEMIEIKRGKVGISKAVDTTWASDKYRTPLQVANLNLVSYDTINKANRLFQKNLFDLKVGEHIKIVNPADGNMMDVSIPQFGAICSNLPFVSFENISEEDKDLVGKFIDANMIDRKADLSYFMVLYLATLLENEGRLGVIVSNSWLGTKAGDKFYHALTERFDLQQVHISGRGRWFANADVVTTILILQKKSNMGEHEATTSFFVWKKSLEAISLDSKIEQEIVDSALLNRVTDNTVTQQSTYSMGQIEKLKALNISYNALFHDVLWLLEIKEKLVPLKSVFDVFRGSRRGWNDLFFPVGVTEIESNYLRPALFNAKNVEKLIVTPDRQAFCCGDSLELLEEQAPGAFRWIMKFKGLTNGTGKPLEKVLARAHEKWYELKPNEVAQFFTMMNPDSRFFFGRFMEPSFVNQRLIGLRVKDEMLDKKLLHALLNSVLMKFFIESVGFGRGLSVLDVNKEGISNCFMLNPALISEEDSYRIKKTFDLVLAKRIMSIEEELKDEDWVTFNHTVLQVFGLDSYYLRISHSLLSMRQVRKTAREMQKKTAVVKDISKPRKEGEENAIYEPSIAAETRKAR